MNAISQDPVVRKYLLSCLKEMISEERWARFNEVISYRTRYLTVALEDIFQPHNASAVIRTCELTGINDLHIIENQNTYQINPDIVVGSDKWINIFKYNTAAYNTLECYSRLRAQGYKIIATTPHKNDHMLEEIPLDHKIALIFGNEGFGLSKQAIENADGYLRIPAFGFTESYNISVAVALCLYQLTARLHTGNHNWQLSQEEKDELLLDYSLKSMRNSRVLVERLLKDQPS